VSVKLGQPEPESNFVLDVNRTLPQAAHLYCPVSLLWRSVPVHGGSVSLPYSTRSWRGVSFLGIYSSFMCCVMLTNNLLYNAGFIVQSFFFMMRVLIVNNLCGFAQLLKGSFPNSNELIRIPSFGWLLVIRQHILSSVLLSILFDIIRAGRCFAPVRSE
jgi:hypothetical protein